MRTLILLALVLFASTAVAQPTFNFVTQSDGLNYACLNYSFPRWGGYNIVFIGDGFQASEMNSFDTAVDHCIHDNSETGDGLLGIPPYQTSACRLRMWRIQLISNSSGIDEPKKNLWRNTPLDCSFGNTGDPYMKISGDPAKVVAAVAASGLTEWDFIVVITNTPTQYGAYFPSSGNIVYISSGNAWGIYLAHELAHALASLGDEYECQTCDPSVAETPRTYAGTGKPEPNLSTDLNHIKWEDLIEPWVINYGFIPTLPENMCDCDVVGAWEGGGNYTFGVYRSEEYCAMDAFMCSVDDAFCAACNRALEDVLMSCDFWWDFLAHLREWPPIIYKIPPCFTCPPERGAAHDLIADIKFDAIIMKLLHRGPIDRFPDPRTRIAVYDDWFERVPVEVEVKPDGIDISFSASRIRTYTVVMDVEGLFDRHEDVRFELIRNGSREETIVR